MEGMRRHLTIARICIVLASLNNPSIFTVHAFSTKNILRDSSNPATTYIDTKRLIPKPTTSIILSSSSSSLLQAIKIPNPFVRDNEDSKAEENVEFLPPRPPAALQQKPQSPSEFLDNEDLNSEVLFAKARNVISTDIAINTESLLDENFIWIGPNGGKVLGKKEYLAAGKFFNLRATFPDLDYRAHDFRLDSKDPLTVRVTVRVVGTMRGKLRLRRDIISPNGKRLICPPEAISMTFNASNGKLIKLCSGFTMDYLVGNTKGLCGVMGAAAFVGAQPSAWDIYPPSKVIERFFARPLKQLPEEQTSFLAPFPESVMIQLAKGVYAADNGASDPDLLAPSFTFYGPLLGPKTKNDFVEDYDKFNIKNGFPDFDADFTNFRVDPYDPYRVWVDVRGSGTRTGIFADAEPTGLSYEGPPEAYSYTFDDEGFCTRLTAGFVMDPSEGNTGGLGGVVGVLYATGTPSPGILSRPVPALLGRIQKRTLSPLTKIDVDDLSLPDGEIFGLIGSNLSESLKAAKIPKPPPLPPKAATQSAKSSSVQFKPKLPAPPKPPPITQKSPVKKIMQKSPVKKKSTTSPRPPSFSKPNLKPPSRPKAKQTKSTESKLGSFFGGDKNKSVTTTSKATGQNFLTMQKEKVSQQQKQKAENMKVQAKAMKEKTDLAVKAKREKAVAAASIQKEKIAKAQKENAEAAKKAKEDSAKKMRENMARLNKAKAAPEAATSKPNFFTKKTAPKPKAKPVAPKGVPSLSRWRVNFDKSVSGNVSGSRGFDDGEKITTSTISSGEFKPGNVVVTETGSKYFLE